MNVERWLNDSSNYWSDDDFYARAQKSSQKGFTIYHTQTQLLIIETTKLSDFKPPTKKKPEKVKPKKTHQVIQEIHSISSLNSVASSEKSAKKKPTIVSNRKNDLKQNNSKYWTATQLPNYREIERLARRINKILNAEIIF
jgi:hypothetical protein